MGRPPASPKPGGMVQKRYQWIVLPKQTWQGNGLDGGSREGEDKELVQCSGSNRLIATLTIELDSLGWSQRWLRPSRLLSYCFLKRGDLLRQAFKHAALSDCRSAARPASSGEFRRQRQQLRRLAAVHSSRRDV